MPDLPLLIQPGELEQALGNSDLLIVDLCSEKVYQQAHIPGAIHMAPAEILGGEKPATGQLPTPDQLSAALSRIGLTPEKHVIAYDDEGGGWAGRLLWTLEVVGHKKFSYLDGGIHSWLAEGLPTETHTTKAETSSYTVPALDDSAVADKDFVLANYDRENVTVWDARSTDEFSGARALATRGGRIPGAVHYEWTKGMDKNNSLRIRNLDEVRGELAELGIKQDREIITHCQTHHRSSFTWLLGKILGLNIRAYPGSWSEWGNDPDTPVESDVE